MTASVPHSEDRARHPNVLRLEAFACDERAPEVAAHLETCVACRAFVARARDAALQAPALDLARVFSRTRERESSRRFTAFAYAGAFLAVASAALLLLGVPRATPRSPLAAAVPPHPQLEPDTSFKGGVQLAVIRERDGGLDRFTDTLRVRPGDRLRIEVAVDRPSLIVGGVLGEDGTYVELMDAGLRSAGTHFSERSARVDTRPLRGTVLVGSPDAVRRAQTGGDHRGLVSLRVEWEDAP